MLLSIIIAHWNEPPGVLRQTLQSLTETIDGEAVEVIVVDDHSKHVPRQSDLQEWSNYVYPVRIFRQNVRQGHAAARQCGVMHALGEWIMFTDAHMIFENDWMRWFKYHTIKSNTKEIFCGPYLASRAEHEPNNSPVIFHGARFYFWQQEQDSLSIIDFKPVFGFRTKIECVVGANYFMHKSWFVRIGGLPGLYGWSGTDEWIMSVKTWLCGGKVNIEPRMRIRHILYPTGIGDTGYGKDMKRIELLTNRLSSAYQVLEPKIFDRFLSSCRIKAQADKKLYDEAMKRIEIMPEVEQARRYLSGQVEYDCDWLCEELNLRHPDDLIHL